MLIDAGGPVGGQQTEFDFGENVVSPYLWERRISRLDVVAITHGHSDHLGGMHAVLNNFRPHELWVGALPQTPAIRSRMDFAESLGIRVVRHIDGESFDFRGMQVTVFSPLGAWQTSAQARNNDSLVLRLQYRESSALLEGDACGVAGTALGSVKSGPSRERHQFNAGVHECGPPPLGHHFGGKRKPVRSPEDGDLRTIAGSRSSDLSHRSEWSGQLLP